MPEASERRERPSPPKVRFPLRRKLALLALCLSVIPLGILGWLLIDVNADTVETSSRELQIAVAQDLARTIENEFTAAEDGLVAVASALVDTQLSDDERLRVAMVLVASNSYLDHAAVYGPDGAYIDTIKAAPIDVSTVPKRIDDFSREQAADEGVAQGAPIRFAESTRVPVVVPLQVGGRTTGFVWSAIDLQPVQARVGFLADAHFTDLPDALFVVDETLHFVAHVDPKKYEALAAAPSRGLLAGIDHNSLDKRLSQSGEFELDGAAYVGTLSKMETRPWLIGVQVPRDVAYASLVTMRTVATGATVATILIALLAGLWGAGALTRPVDALTQFANVLAQRRFGETLVLDTGDELAVLGHAMTSASLDLQASEKEIAQQIAIRNDLGRYLPGEIVDKVIAREQDMALGGTRREITVMFADVVAFTPLTEKLEPEQVVQILNELFTIATEIIFRHGGTVDKFIGDCVMAIWGAPTPQEDHAARAVAAAEEILSWLEFGNDRWREDFGVSVQIAIGINTGDAVVGNIGSETRMEYTAIGDAVNVAARLETIARPQQILVSARTAELAGDGFRLVPLGHKTLSGRTEDIELFEVRS